MSATPFRPETLTECPLAAPETATIADLLERLRCANLLRCAHHAPCSCHSLHHLRDALAQKIQTPAHRSLWR